MDSSGSYRCRLSLRPGLGLVQGDVTQGLNLHVAGNFIKGKHIDAGDQASSELFSELGRYPTDQEMARRLGVTQDQYQEDLANSSMCNVLSLDALFEDREQSGGAEVPDGGLDSRPEDSMLRQELLETLTKAIESLRENEQTVISLYYHKNLSMKEIAQVMEVSEPRIIWRQNMRLISGQFLIHRLVLVANTDSHHLIKGSIGVVFSLIARGGNVGHVVGHHIQPAPSYLAAPLPGNPEAEAIYESVYDRRKINRPNERSLAL